MWYATLISWNSIIYHGFPIMYCTFSIMTGSSPTFLCKLSITIRQDKVFLLIYVSIVLLGLFIILFTNSFLILLKGASIHIYFPIYAWPLSLLSSLGPIWEGKSLHVYGFYVFIYLYFTLLDWRFFLCRVKNSDIFMLKY